MSDVAIEAARARNRTAAAELAARAVALHDKLAGRCEGLSDHYLAQVGWEPALEMLAERQRARTIAKPLRRVTDGR